MAVLNRIRSMAMVTTLVLRVKLEAHSKAAPSIHSRRSPPKIVPMPLRWRGRKFLRRRSVDSCIVTRSRNLVLAEAASAASADGMSS